jgi:hypothetical protein
MTLIKMLIPIATLVLIACPKPEPENCPDNYHWDEDKSECVMDTTNHSFTWTIDTLGSFASSIRDIAIVNENNIWAVGQIIVPDPDSTYTSGRLSYNAAHWDGNEWEMLNIINSTLLYSITYFNEDDIWVVKHTFPVHWDGEEWTQYHLQNMGLDVAGTGKSCWGTSSDNMYFAGKDGNVVHYDGSTFTKLSTGLSVGFKSISGKENGDFVTVGYNTSGESASAMVEYKGSNFLTLYNPDYLPTAEYGAVHCVDYVGDRYLMGCSYGILDYNSETQVFNLLGNDILEWSSYHSIRTIQSQAPNDVVAVSNWGGFAYYNGNTWNSHTGIEEQVAVNGSFVAYGMDYKDDMVVIGGVGDTDSIYLEAIIIIGKSNN